MITTPLPGEPQRVDFLLLPEFSMLGFVSAVEPLRVANRFGGALYQWRILSADGGAVTASNGMSVNADAALASTDAPMLFVVAAFHAAQYYTEALGHALRRACYAGAALGAIDTGSFVLAEAGLLDGYTVTLHWEALSAFRECYPAITVTQELFEVDRQRVTSAGGTASIDLMLELIARQHGRGLAAAVSEQFVLGRIRRPSDHQRMHVAARYGLHNARAVRAIELMEQHLEDPLSAEQLAAMAGVSRRQLERLFLAHLKQTPTHFYLGLRLERARELLHETELEVQAIALACGFPTSSYFARSYRSRFGLTPSSERAGR